MSEIELGPLDDFPDGECRVLAIGGLEIGVFRRGRRLLAYRNECPHFGGPVCQGRIFPGVEEMLAPDQTSKGLRFGSAAHIVCPWHGYEFDIETGCHPGDPSLRLDPVGIDLRGERVYLALPA